MFSFVPHSHGCCAPKVESLSDILDVIGDTAEIIDVMKPVYNFKAKELMVPIYQGGKLVYQRPSLDELKQYCAEQVDTLWDEYKRFENPQTYYVDLSQKLYDIRQELLHEGGKF